MKAGRRSFLLSGLAAASSGCALWKDEPPVRFLTAADVHYRPGVFPHDTHEQLQRIIGRGVSESVDFGLQLGDFQHNAKRDRAFVDLWADAPFRTYSVLGNHDDDATTAEETRAAFRLERSWYFADCRFVRLIVLDTNFAALGHRYVHYAKDSGFVQWKLPKGTGMRLHPEEFPFLEEAIATAPGVCIVAAHRSLASDDPDALRVRQILDAANRRTSGKVPLVLNGHHHCDRLQRLGEISYLTVNSPNHCWIPFAHRAYPEEDLRRWTGIGHVLAYDGTPLSAVISMYQDGRFSVSGMTGGFWRGISPERISPRLKTGYTASIVNRPLETA